MGFIIYMLTVVVFGLVFPRVPHKAPNYVLIHCTACGSKLYQRPSTKRWAFVDTLGWGLIAWFVVWQHHLPFFISFVFAVVLVFAWTIAVRRVVHAYWLWRHPLRCQGGGHLNPVPQGT